MVAARSAADGPILGVGLLEFPLLDNTHSVEVTVAVHPDYRRRGAGTAIVEHMGSSPGPTAAHSINTIVDVPVGRADQHASLHFAPKVGFVATLGGNTRRLDLPSIRPSHASCVRSWPPPARRPDYRMLTFVPPWPDEFAEDEWELLRVMSTDEPAGDGEQEEEVWDAARMGESDELRAARGATKFCAAAQHVPDGPLVAMTEILVCEDEPHQSWQLVTVVHPAHRGHRLGLAVKLANVDFLCRQAPEIEVRHHGQRGGQVADDRRQRHDGLRSSARASSGRNASSRSEGRWWRPANDPIHIDTIDPARRPGAFPRRMVRRAGVASTGRSGLTRPAGNEQSAWAVALDEGPEGIPLPWWPARRNELLGVVGPRDVPLGDPACGPARMFWPWPPCTAAKGSARLIVEAARAVRLRRKGRVPSPGGSDYTPSEPGSVDVPVPLRAIRPPAARSRPWCAGTLRRPLAPERAAQLREGRWGPVADDPSTWTIAGPTSTSKTVRLGRRMSTDVPTGEQELDEEEWDADRVRALEATLAGATAPSSPPSPDAARGRLVAFSESPSRWSAESVGGTTRSSCASTVATAGLRHRRRPNSWPCRSATRPARTDQDRGMRTRTITVIAVNAAIGFEVTARSVSWRKLLGA